MIAIVRMKAQLEREKLWSQVVAQSSELQTKLGRRGCLLYLSRRARHEDVSLFVHTVDADVLSTFIARELGAIEGLTDVWLLHMLNPAFFPLPRYTGDMQRFAITAAVFPARLEEVYASLFQQLPPSGLLRAYLAYTFHLFGDSLQFSVLAKDEESVSKYVAEKVSCLPGVARTTISLIERTKPLVSYDEWKKYSARHSLVSSWNESYMVEQFSQ